ncbi:MAG: hypothetical protein ACLR4Z_07950 [Butyricicoccaceae bacterium]
MQDSDAIFLTVPDRAITPVYLELRSFSFQANKYVIAGSALSARDAFPASWRQVRSVFPSIRFFPSAAGTIRTGNLRMLLSVWRAKKRHPGMENAAGVLRLHGADHRCSGQAALSCGLRHGE